MGTVSFLDQEGCQPTSSYWELLSRRQKATTVVSAVLSLTHSVCRCYVLLMPGAGGRWLVHARRGL